MHANGIKWVQEIVGCLLYCAHTADNKLLGDLSEIGSQQAAATERKNQAIAQLINYVATYPNNSIIYQASDMILAAHADAEYLNVRKARSRIGAHIMLVENEPVQCCNGPVLTIAQIIKYGMSSAAKAELSKLFITAKNMVPIHQALIEMIWPPPKTPIQN